MFSLKTKLKVGDTVIVNNGKDRGKSGKILKIDKKRSRLIVEGVAIVKRHRKGNQQVASQIVEQEGSIHISNASIVGKTGKAIKDRIKYEVIDGKKQRVLVKAGETL